MKNNLVINAISLGLATVISMAQPLSALAAEDGLGNGEPTGGETSLSDIQGGIADSAQKAAEEAQNAVSFAADATTEVTTESGESEVTTKEHIGNASDDIQAADDQLLIAEAEAQTSDTQLKNAETAATEVTSAAEDLNSIVDIASGVVEEQTGNIQNATTIAEANAAYVSAEETVNAAETDFQKKLDEYTAAKDAYSAAKIAVEEAEKLYADAIADATTDASKAKEELDAAKANADTLAQAVSAAKANVEQSTAGALDILEKAEAVKKPENMTDGEWNTEKWKKRDELFVSIMTNYYLPEQAGIVAEDVEVTRVAGKDNHNYNYFKVTYKDNNGVLQTKYYNYKLADSSETEIVIFEKREVEVGANNAENEAEYTKEHADQYTYTDKDGKIVILSKDAYNQMASNSEIVEASTDDGKNKNSYLVGTSTGSSSLVESSATDGTRDIVVGEPKTTEWRVDGNGTLVQITKADVTTTTYTGKSFTSSSEFSEKFESEEEAKTAAKNKVGELTGEGHKATEEDITISAETKYVVSGTYIPTFTDKIEVDKVCEYRPNSDWAIYNAKTDLNGEIRTNDAYKEMHIIEISYDLQAEMVKDNHIGIINIPFDDYAVTGNATVTYAEVTVEKRPFSSWQTLFSKLGWSDQEKVTKENVKKALEADGHILVDYNSWDWSWDSATVKYLKAEKITSDQADSEEDAKANLNAKLEANNQGSYNLQTSTSAEIKYSYAFDYLENQGSETVEKDVAKVEYKDAKLVNAEIVQNKNYKDKVNLWNQSGNEAFNTYLEEKNALYEKYEALYDEAVAAQTALKTAQDKVATLQSEITTLSENRTSNLKALNDLQTKLDEAVTAEETAQKNLTALLTALDNAKAELDKTVARLTPAPAPAPAATQEDDTEEETAPEAIAITTPQTVIPVTPLVAQRTLTIEDEPVALVSTTNTTTTITEDESVVNGAVSENELAKSQISSATENGGDTIQILDEQIPLVDSVDSMEEAKKTMSWWWLLIVALLGKTGYEMYKKHNQKKELEETEQK